MTHLEYEYVIINYTNSNTMGVYQTFHDAAQAIFKLHQTWPYKFGVQKRIK